MKPFNLEEAKAGKPVTTRSGKFVELLKFDGALGLIGGLSYERDETFWQGEWTVWNELGQPIHHCNGECDLFML